MNSPQVIECVPNFSEGVDSKIIKVCTSISIISRFNNTIQQITDEIESVEGVKLLNVDPGKATNRTVVTFVGMFRRES